MFENDIFDNYGKYWSLGNNNLWQDPEVKATVFLTLHLIQELYFNKPKKTQVSKLQTSMWWFTQFWLRKAIVKIASRPILTWLTAWICDGSNCPPFSSRADRRMSHDSWRERGTEGGRGGRTGGRGCLKRVCGPWSFKKPWALLVNALIRNNSTPPHTHTPPPTHTRMPAHTCTHAHTDTHMPAHTCMHAPTHTQRLTHT